MPNNRLGRHARRWISVGIIVVVAGSGGATAWAVTGPSGSDYRTATVTRGDVTQSLISTGTIEPISEANVSFPVSGQVSSVSVSLGSHVTAGQVLARLSTSALASDVSSAESSVATANERLAADEASETTTTAYLTTTASVTTTAYVTVDPAGGTGSGGSSGTGGTGGTGGSGGGSGGSGTGGSGGTGGSSSSGTGGSGSKSPIAGELRAIGDEQRVVVAAQHRLDGQLTEAKSLLSVEGTLCTATSTPTPPPGGTPTSTPTGTPTGTASPLPTPTPAVSQSSPSPTPTPSVTPSQSATPGSSATGSDAATQSSTVAPTTAATAMAYLSTQPTGAPGGGPSPTTCQAAIDDLMSVQTSIASTEQSLANSEADLDHLLGEVYTALEKTAGSGSGSGGTGSGGTGSGGQTGTGGSGSGGSGGGRTGTSGGTGGSEGGSGGGGAGGSASSGPATAAELASDQADLDSANAELSEARQNLAAASLAAPISGTVALVNVTSGQQVTGSQGTSTSADFVIEGAGGEEATTSVSVSDVGEIKVGQPATITLDGSATPINGRVDSIGMLSSTSSSGSASYPVTIGLAAGEPTLFAGSDAQVAITLAQVGDAVTVPTSAVEGTGAAAFVTVLQAGKPERVRVVVGAAGPVLTQVTSGLSVGEQVVLADMSTPLPTNTNPFAARSLTTGGGGGFGGARTAGGGAAGRSAAGG